MLKWIRNNNFCISNIFVENLLYMKNIQKNKYLSKVPLNVKVSIQSEAAMFEFFEKNIAEKNKHHCKTYII